MRTILLLLIAAALVACKPSERVITGQVFIATQGGANVKLGGIQVLAVPAALAEQREKETMAGHEKELAQIRLTRAAAAEKKKAAEEAFAKSNAAYHLWKTTSDKVERLDAIEANNVAAMARLPAKEREKAAAINDEVAESRRNLLSGSSQLFQDHRALSAASDVARKAADEAEKLVLSDDDILALVPRLAKLKWPEAVARATTDADGKFTLRVRGGNVAVVATGLRLVFKESELYFWRVPVPDGEQAEVMLTGANAKSMEGSFSSGKKADAE